MSICQNCKNEIENDSTFCRFCGKKVKAAETSQKSRGKKSRGNGQGSVYKFGKKWKAEVTLGYRTSADGKDKRIKRTKICDSKKEAIDILLELRNRVSTFNANPTLSELFDQWLPIHERKVNRSTMNCYKAAYKHIKNLHYSKFAELRTEHWQNELDNCPLGARTKENIKALGTLLYAYAISQDIVSKDYASFVYIKHEKAQEKTFFSSQTLDLLFDMAKTDDRAKYVVIMCYTGFRIEEFLSLTKESYNEQYKYFVGGSKTEAGRDRVVTVSPKIQPYVDYFMKDGYIFSDDGKKMGVKKFRDKIFNTLLEDIGIQETLPDGRHKYTPHCTRHTFATLIKDIEAPMADKRKLIGHSSDTMLYRYTHSEIIDLQKITNAI